MKELNSIIEQEEIEVPDSIESKKQRYFSSLRSQFASLPMGIFADVRNKKLKHRDVCLYAHLLVKQGLNKSSFWGVDSLALLTGTNKTSIKESLRRLLACGHIKRARGKNTSHSVCLTKLTSGLGFEGIRIKGKNAGEIEQEEDSQPVEPSICQPSITVVDGQERGVFCSGRTWRGPGGACASWTSAAPGR